MFKTNKKADHSFALADLMAKDGMSSNVWEGLMDLQYNFDRLWSPKTRVGQC